MQVTDERNLETIPVGPLGSFPLESCKELGDKDQQLSDCLAQ